MSFGRGAIGELLSWSRTIFWGPKIWCFVIIYLLGSNRRGWSRRLEWSLTRFRPRHLVPRGDRHFNLDDYDSGYQDVNPSDVVDIMLEERSAKRTIP